MIYQKISLFLPLSMKKKLGKGILKEEFEYLDPSKAEERVSDAAKQHSSGGNCTHL